MGTGHFLEFPTITVLVLESVPFCPYQFTQNWGVRALFCVTKWEANNWLAKWQIIVILEKHFLLQCFSSSNQARNILSPHSTTARPPFLCWYLCLNPLVRVWATCKTKWNNKYDLLISWASFYDFSLPSPHPHMVIHSHQPPWQFIYPLKSSKQKLACIWSFAGINFTSTAYITHNPFGSKSTCVSSDTVIMYLSER